MCFFLICLPPGRRLLLTLGMGMGGTIQDDFSTNFFVRNSTILILRKKSQNISLNMFIYTKNDIDSHRNTQNINIYAKTPKALEFMIKFTENINVLKIHFSFQKNQVQNDQRYMLICMALFIFCIFYIILYILYILYIVEGHTA